MNSVVMSTAVMFPSSVESHDFVGHPSDFHVLKTIFHRDGKCLRCVHYNFTAHVHKI